jgi:hypothetical protein
MGKENIVHMEFYSAMKNEIMPFAGKWMELEIIILIEISQSHKNKSHLFSLICGSWVVVVRGNHESKRQY